MPDQPEPTNPAAETAPLLCGKTIGIGTPLPYHPCARPAGHPEAYCKDVIGDHMFLAASGVQPDTRPECGTCSLPVPRHSAACPNKPTPRHTGDGIQGNGYTPAQLLGADYDTRPSDLGPADGQQKMRLLEKLRASLTPIEPVPDTERREWYAAALYEQANPGFLWVDALAAEVPDSGWREAADAALAVADEEQRDLRAELASVKGRLVDYENRITWDTNCGEHARLLDSCRAADERAEKAIRRACDEYDKRQGLEQVIDGLRAELEKARATVLRERADFLESVLRDSLDPDSDPRYCTAIHDVILGLRRLAAETDAARSGGQAEDGAQPAHAGGDAEDCPVCRPQIDKTVLYPWICPGAAGEDGAQQK
ncbi:hypothetical protein [Streptomyces sp. NPDC058653]|uniref:hypothetical protein n=1 Tax=Streptomyces sp. NPDC058653 TaxID=3346576 RepID=UPI00364FDDC0